MPDTLEGQLASVSSDGSVYWSRPGMMDVLCKFSGLVGFPFDQLQCSFELGGWMLSGWQQGVHLREAAPNYSTSQTGPGWLLESEQATAGQAYTQHMIEAVQASISNYYYPWSPDEPYSVAR